MITVIAAVAKNNVIGAKGKLAWHLPEDLRHFKTLTTGKTVLMGERTWHSLPEKARPLPNRKNVVVTHDPNFAAPDGVLVYLSLDQALDELSPSQEVMVMGGAMVYAQAIKRADKLEITLLNREVEGDVFFPQIEPAIWKETAREPHDGFAFVTYERI